MNNRSKIEQVEARLDGRKWYYRIPEKRHWMFLLSAGCTAMTGTGTCLFMLERGRSMQYMLFSFIILIAAPLYTATKYLCE